MRQLLLVITLLLAATPVSGQIADSLRLRPGDPVRFPGPLPGQATLVDGTVVSVLPHAFEFSVRGASGQTYTRSYDTLTSIDVGYHDAGKSARTGGLWGLFVGGVLGLVSGPFLAPHLSVDTGPAMALSAAGAGLIGIGIGAAAGALMAPTRWNRYVFQPTTGGVRAACLPPASGC